MPGTYNHAEFSSVDAYHPVRDGLAGMGCGPIAIATVLSGYDINKDPAKVGTELMDTARRLGIKRTIRLSSMAKSITDNNKAVTAKAHYFKNYGSGKSGDEKLVYNELKKELEQGHYIVIYVGACRWANSNNHFISLLGIDLSNNKVFIGNKNKSKNKYEWSDLMDVVKVRKYNQGWLEIY